MIRKVCGKDFDVLYSWINDEEVIKNSRYQKRKTINKFKIWMNEMINDNDSYMFILEVDNIPMGQINFAIEDDEAVLTYSIDKNYRGKGYGKQLVSYVEEFIAKEQLECNKISAYINSGNIASIKVFEYLNYKYEIDESDYKKMYKNIIE